MGRDYFELGPVPADEECAQLGTENYDVIAREECQRFIDLIRTSCGREPKNTELAIKPMLHDFGTYYEVVCYYDEKDDEAVGYVLDLETSIPTNWT